ncbi:MAG: hypothetical protein QOK15_2224 [Nocardioidaceae bacterium]|nr:hypothetical protein [Nocardioidaceae bacterium]
MPRSESSPSSRQDHIDHIDPSVPVSGDGCVECLSSDPGGWWFHLRRCALCGHVGCCDTSPQQHATAHYRTTGHRVIVSYEPGEDWGYDFATEEMLGGVRLQPPESHPLDQPTPGPAGAVPADWEAHLHG